jgi:prepilin-type N-terminal cleavage/methylation domain-containing protein
MELLKGFNTKKGFTLIEVIVTMAIMTLVLSTGFFVSFDYYRNNSLGSEQELIATLLRKIRNQSMNNINQLSHGLHIDGENYILFQGDVFNISDPLNELIPRNHAFTIQYPREIIFSALSGEVNRTSVEDIHITDGNYEKTISINEEGQISW